MNGDVLGARKHHAKRPRVDADPSHIPSAPPASADKSEAQRSLERLAQHISNWSNTKKKSDSFWTLLG
jgi:hypothetical protein